MVLAGLAWAGIAQTAAACALARRFPPKTRGAHLRPGITIFKPLHGDEILLEEALETFFRQEYPAYQIVMGVQSRNDGAIAVVERLRARYPHVDAVLVVDPTPHGANRKIANLINMYPYARYDVFLVSDSDMHVTPDYLHRVAETLERPGVGLVTSIYIGVPAGSGLIPQLGSAYINQIFASGALMSRKLGRRDCMGATMALTRQTLMRIGGFPALSPYVADDGVLGKRVRELGLDVALAPTVPATTVSETTLPALFRHELRWARTIRAMAPFGFVSSAIQFPVFWACLTVLAMPDAAWSWWLLALSCAMRAASGRAIERALGAVPTALILAPVRDLLSMAVMITAFFGDRVAWRGQVLSIAADREQGQGRRPIALNPRTNGGHAAIPREPVAPGTFFGFQRPPAFGDGSEEQRSPETLGIS